MSRAKFFTQAAIAILGVTLFIAVASPWGFYWLGLHGVDGRPNPPSQISSVEDQLKKWQHAKGIGAPQIPKLSPYTYLNSLAGLSAEGPGILVAWWIASEYLAEHQRYRGMGWWHLSGAALTIWLTRNWTDEQLLSAPGRKENAG